MTADEAAAVMRSAMQACVADGWRFQCHWSESFWMSRDMDAEVLIQSDYETPKGLLYPEEIKP